VVLSHYPGTSARAKSFEYPFQYCSRVHAGGAALTRKAWDVVALCCLVGGGGEVGSGNGQWGRLALELQGKVRFVSLGLKRGVMVGRGGQWRGVGRTVEITRRICMGDGE
jgi:hypothetical protein